jgi:hypothetical protein
MSNAVERVVTPRQIGRRIKYHDSSKQTWEARQQ